MRWAHHAGIAALGLALAVLSALALPTDAAAIDVTVEVRPGVSVPISKFVSRYPLPLEATGIELQLGEFDVAALRLGLENDAGLQMAFTVLLDQVELSYAFGRYTWGRLEVEALSVDVGGGPAEFLDNVFIDIGEVTDGDPVLSQDADEALAPIYLHRLLVGYRFFVLDGSIRPYIPLALGPAVIHGDDFDTIFGGGVEAGLGCQYVFQSGWAIGLDLRYSATLMENPALKVVSLTDSAIATATANSSLFETVIRVFQAFTISVSGNFTL